MGRIGVLLTVFVFVTAVRIFAQSGQSSFEFVENKGQWDKSVLFRGELFSAEFYTQKKGFTVALHNPDDLQRAMGSHGDHAAAARSAKAGKTISYKKDLSGTVTDHSLTGPESIIIRSHAYSVEFVNGNENAMVLPDKAIASYNNYFIGNDPSKWASKVRIFQAVLYKDVYPNIDVRYYSEDGRLKYDLIVNPGGDPSKIALKYTGPDKLTVRNNELIVKTSVGEMKELYPYTFQSDKVSGRKEIPCKYLLNGNTVKFQLDAYDKKSVLVIDPTLIFSSFTGSLANQYGFTATPGPDGSLYSGGIVFGPRFPTTPGAFQENFQGGGSQMHGTDIGIMKFSANGSQRVYATYLGGANGNDYPHSLICDPQGNLICMGRSYASDYPGVVATDASGRGKNSNGSIVVTKLNSNGTALIGSLIYGGSGLDGANIGDIQQTEQHGGRSLLRNYGDDSRSEVTLDNGNNIYVAAQSQSNDFPIFGGGFQKDLGGKQDGVVIKINPNCTSTIWSTYLGGKGDDGAFVIDIDPLNNNVYVAGGTTSGAPGDGVFPGDQSGTIGTSFQGGETDGYVAILSNDGHSLIKSTYIGSTGIDIIYGLKFDRKGFPYVMGTTRGPWKQLNAAFGSPNNSQFVAKLEPDLSKYDYTTTFGSGSKKPNISPVAFLVDRCENLYISGWGGWIDTGTDPYDQAGVAGLPVTPDAIKPTTDDRDFYFMVIQKNASALLYGTFFGQVGGRYGEHVDGGTSRYDQQGVIYQAICANCQGGATFPTTPGVIGPVNGTGKDGCNLAAVKIAFDFAGVASGPESFVNGIHDSVGCAPFTVDLEDTIRNAKSYIWSFGDGTPDSATTNFKLTHVFNAVGFYKVRLIAIDSNKCNVSDTAYTFIKVGDDRADLKMNITKLDPCESLSYSFDNLSTSNRRAFGDSSFVWDFGDGSRVSSNASSVKHDYAQPGTYHVELVLVDTNYCNSPDSIGIDLRVNPLVKAQFETPPSGCAPYDAVFVNTSLAGQTFAWDFGDGSVSTDVNPTHHYENPGTFVIHLTVTDSGTCNIKDDTTMTLVVSKKPTAEFSFAPVVPLQNKPTIFTNQSIGGVRYKWMFGDGDSVVKNTADTVLHQYNASGTFNACLITYNQYECTDTVCHDVQADILPLLDVPNAFTPGKFGRNAIVRVQGFGITKMSWKIYNRFGQKVFETNSRFGGWDGTYNGQLQPVDVYGYTLDVQFSDGTKTRKTGDITLIR